MLYFWYIRLLGNTSCFMEHNIFSPRLNKVDKDSLSSSLQTFAQGVLILLFGLLPILFIPGVYTALGFTKSYFVALGVFVALVALSLSVLRSGSIRLVIPPALAFYWLFVLFALASALLSGDSADAIFGNVLEVHTVGFMTLLGIVMTVSLAFTGAKASVSRLFTALGISAILLQTFHILRLMFGPELFDFQIFTSQTVSLIGSFNDLAIFSGLVILVTLIVLQQLTARIWGQVVAGFLVLSSLLFLAIVNFYSIWVILGFMSLLMALYLISKDTWLKGATTDTVPVSRFGLAMVGLVCLVSALFVISGDFAGGVVNRATGINYLEIRPSLSATLDVTKAVIAEDALFGVGPNRFEDAWRQYKNPVINQTLFWNTSFGAGSGYVPTLFVTTGIVGGLLFLLFLLAFIYVGYKTLFATKIQDYGWYLVGTVSFISALYLWAITLVYVPGTTILLLAALMTGVAFAVYVTVSAQSGVQIDVSTNRQYGLLLIAVVLVVIITSTLSVIGLTKQYVANVTYADTVRAFQTGADLAQTDEGLLRSQELNTQDIFVAERASLRLAELNRLSSLPAEEVDEQRFDSVLAEGVGLAELAISLDPTNPNNHMLLSSFYGLLDPSQFEGIQERNQALFARARELDPVNPIYLVQLAQYQARVGDLAATRASLLEAINIKNNYTDALFLLSQLDIQEGKTEDAITVTRSIISLEPNNPTRYFQLGVLLATTNNLPAAVSAFETAILLDTNYANARYFLALAYLDLERPEDALAQLKIVEASNQENTSLKTLIGEVESGNYARPESTFEVPVQNSDVVSQEEGVTTSTEVPDTTLVAPVNRPAGEGEEGDTAEEPTPSTPE